MKVILSDVSKRIHKIDILNRVCMEMHEGRIYGLSGINGSGKTMILRMLCGLIKPTEGEIRIDGKLLHKDISFPESVGILIENPAFLDAYTGYQNLCILANIQNRISGEETAAVIKRVGLDPDSKKKYKHYSLGMKQRLGIAAAVMEKPEIILLDEPTNALDSKGVEMLKALVREEKARGALVVMACHDALLLRETADEIFFIEEGAIVEHEVLRADGE